MYSWWTFLPPNLWSGCLRAFKSLRWVKWETRKSSGQRGDTLSNWIFKSLRAKQFRILKENFLKMCLNSSNTWHEISTQHWPFTLCISVKAKKLVRHACVLFSTKAEMLKRQHKKAKQKKHETEVRKVEHACFYLPHLIDNRMKRSWTKETQLLLKHTSISDSNKGELFTLHWLFLKGKEWKKWGWIIMRTALSLLTSQGRKNTAD